MGVDPSDVSPGKLDMMVVDDFDGDGIDDVISVRTNFPLDTATFQRGRGNGFFATAVDIYTTTPIGGIKHAVARDLNRDGKLDLLLQENLKKLVFLAGNGDGTFANPVSSPVATGALFTIADLTGDDVDDVAAFYYNETASGMVLYLGNLLGTFTATTKVPLPGPPGAIFAGDLDGDGANDIVAGYAEGPNLEHSSIALLFGNDDGTFDPVVLRFNDETRATTIQLADVENDGDLDIVVENFLDLTFHRNRGGRTFDEVTDYLVPQNFSSLKHRIHFTVADVTGDGELDLIATNGDMIITRRGLGDGTFDHPDLDLFPTSRPASAEIATTDFDGDGRLDLIVGQTFSDGLRALRNRCGDASVSLTANPPSPFLAGQSVTVRVTGYADGFLDLPPTVATGTVSILEGATVLATGTLSNGEVTLTVPGLRPGAHKLVARYNGDDEYEPAQSPRIILRVTFGPATGPPPPRRRAVGR